MRRSGRVVVGAVGLAAAALLAGGCGYGGVESASSHPDLQNGQTLFSATCGSCHTLQAAGTSGTIGPNLDNAFVGSRAEGYASSAIENVVLDQIRLGSGTILNKYPSQQWIAKHCVTPASQAKCLQQQMPAHLLTGQNALDVAAYVASVAGSGGYTASTSFASLGTNGPAIFKGAGCAGCHTLKAAGSTGTIGPSLDQLASALTVSIVIHQVTSPPPGLMPSFKGKLSTAQIQAVAKYVTSVAGK